MLWLTACSGPQGDAPSKSARQLAQDPDVLAIIGGDPFRVQDFEQQYIRSVGSEETAADDSMAAYVDFLERYVNFRLKVRAAEALGLREDPTINAEIKTYRQQLARPYLLESEVLDPLMRELYDRKKELINASHIMARLPESPTPADTAAAYAKMLGYQDSLAAGVDFGDLAYRNSDDPSARRGQGIGYRGNLGYFGGGRMVEAFEDRAFETPVGETSGIFRSSYGYHILKVHDRTENYPDIDVSHIMLRIQPSDSARALALADSIITALKGGADFGELARKYSQDPGSAQRGGSLQTVSYQDDLVAPFKEAAFALENDGDLSEPVLTRYGYHIIKLNKKVPLPTYEEMTPTLKTELARLPRSKAAESEFARGVMRERGARLDTTALMTAASYTMSTINGVVADSVQINIVDRQLTAADSSVVVATLGDSTYTMPQLRDFVISTSVPRKSSAMGQLIALGDAFLESKAIEYEAWALEEKDQRFKSTMAEFQDGLVLFRLMEDSVWTAAANDTLGLMAFHAPRAAEYTYPDRHRLISFYSTDKTALDSIRAEYGTTSNLAALIDGLGESDAAITTDTTLVAGQTNSIYDAGVSVDQGKATMPVAFRGGFLFMVNDGIEAARQKSFEEARAEVLSAYQQVLEDDMIARLRDEYNVATFPERLDQVFADIE
ncbi:MAG: peptidylprolyl isomerase [Rhodothermales bacterium]